MDPQGEGSTGQGVPPTTPPFVIGSAENALQMILHGLQTPDPATQWAWFMAIGRFGSAPIST